MTTPSHMKYSNNLTPPVEAGDQIKSSLESIAILGVSDQTTLRLTGRGLLHLSRCREDLMISRMEIEPVLGNPTQTKKT